MKRYYDDYDLEEAYKEQADKLQEWDWSGWLRKGGCPVSIGLPRSSPGIKRMGRNCWNPSVPEFPETGGYA